MTKQLLVFAHADEAVAFARDGVPHLITGVGKINATLELTRALLADDANFAGVTVLGTAGAVSDDVELGTVYRVSAALQHDYSLSSPTIKLAAIGGGSVTHAPSDLPDAVIATGDVFVQDDAKRTELVSRGASLVDMESYAYASVCARLGVPLQIFKVPSDFADSSTTQAEWDAIVMSKSDELLAFAREHVLSIF